MTVNYTTLLGLAKPVSGTESGTWGDTVNTNLTDYLDSAVAGAQIISGTQTAVTLSKTTGASLSQAGLSNTTGSSQYQIIRCTGSPSSLLIITAPATDKTYVIINATSPPQSVKIVSGGPTTGVTILSGKTSLVAWNGTDFVEVSPNTISGTLPVANGGTGATTLTGVLKGNGTSAFTAASSGTDYSAGTSALATGILKSTTSTGALTIAVAGDFPTLNQSTTGTAATATNLASGSVGTIPYQSASGTTAMLAAGTSGNVLTCNGAAAPSWQPATTGTVTSVTGTAPVISSGGTTPAISIPAATTSTSGYLTNTDWNTFYNKYSTGGALGTPSSGTLSSCTVDGTDAVGFRNIPVNSQSAAYTAVLADSGKCILHPSTDATARTFTIPANGSVAYPIGTAISFVNMTSQVVSIAITTDTMYLAGASTSTTGTRSLAIYGTATALKIASTTWIISGAGLT